MLHPIHRAPSITAKKGSISTSPLPINTEALEAAPFACATASGISLGPWQTPAMNIPSVKVSTGLSLG